MGSISADISQITPPFSVVVRKEGEVSGNRCLSNCDSFPLDFVTDAGTNNYYFIVTDSTGCTFDSRVLGGEGLGSVNCDPTAPSFQAENTPIACVGNTLMPGNVRIYNIQNATRYRVCYGNSIFGCTPCTLSTGVVTPGEDINVIIPNSTPGIFSNYSIRFYTGDGCDIFTDLNGSMYNPVCQSVSLPNFAASFLQPYCDGGAVQNGTLKLTSVTNGTRYKICYAPTFNSTCAAGCLTGDGTISGSTADISIPAPAEGASQAVTIRVFNGNTCNYYKDYSFNMYSQRCSVGEVSMMTMDLQVFPNPSTARCDQPETYNVDYDFFVTPNTPGIAENGIQVHTGYASNRTLPTGNDVPNVFVAAGFKPVCPSGSVGPIGSANGTAINNNFHRFAWNLNLLKAKYPSINIFTFDVYANKVRDDGASSVSNIIRPYINAFRGTAMIRQLYALDSNDAFRNPPDPGVACSSQSCPNAEGLFGNTLSSGTSLEQIKDVTYNTAITGSRKIATVTYNYTTNKVTWTEIPQ